MIFNISRTTSFTEDWDYFASLPPTSRFLYGFTFCVLALYLYLKRPWKYPPGPLIIPFLGSLPFLLFAKGNGILDVLNGLKTRFGGVYSLGWAGKWIVVLAEYEMAKEALIRRGNDFADRPLANKSVTVDCRQPQCGIINSPYTDGWKKQRHLCTSALLRLGMGSHKMDNKILDEVEYFLEIIRGLEGESLDPAKFVRHSVAKSMGQLLFGEQFTDEELSHLDTVCEGGFEKLFKDDAIEYTPTVHSLLPFNRSSPQKEQKLIIERLNKSLKNKIKSVSLSNKQKQDPCNFTQCYRQEIGEGDQRDRLFYILKDFLRAALGTTATTINWGIFYMAKHPEVQKKVFEEIRKVMGVSRRPCFVDRKEMPFVEATISEILRLSPTAPMGLPYRTRCDTQVKDFTIPSGAHVCVSVWSIHRDPARWSKPECFKPERFLDPGGSLVQRDDLVPFGLGRRSCPGEQLAKQEIFLFMVSLLQRFTVEQLDSHPLPEARGILNVHYKPPSYRVCMKSRQGISQPIAE